WTPSPPNHSRHTGNTSWNHSSRRARVETTSDVQEVVSTVAPLALRWLDQRVVSTVAPLALRWLDQRGLGRARVETTGDVQEVVSTVAPLALRMSRPALVEPGEPPRARPCRNHW